MTPTPYAEYPLTSFPTRDSVRVRLALLAVEGSVVNSEESMASRHVGARPSERGDRR